MCVCDSKPGGSFFSLAVIVANSVSIDELPGVNGSKGGWLGSWTPSCLFLPTHHQKHRQKVIKERERRQEEEEEQRKGSTRNYEEEEKKEGGRKRVVYFRF